MEKTKEFHGKLLISITDGKSLGEIKDVFLDKEAKEVIAVYLGKTGLLSRKTHLIHIDQIRLFGVDAWLVNGSDKMVTKDEVEGSDQFILADEVRGRVIQTDGKTKIGTIGDIIVDGRMNVLGFAFDKIYVEGPLSAAKEIARGAITAFGSPMIASLEKAEQLKVEESPRNSKPF
ncbi:MAG: PRC-barrel domain-containing protein [Blastocatellia bacterium]